MKVLAFLAITETPFLLSQLDRFESAGYQALLFVDNPTKCKDPRVIWVPDEACVSSGMFGLNDVLFSDVTSWDRALYYLCQFQAFDFAWLIEDDVFVKDPGCFRILDEKYPEQDLICKSHESRIKNPNWYWWTKISTPELLKGSLHRSMVCACRLSAHILTQIQQYAEDNGKLIFLEAQFSTIAQHYGLSHAHPPELKHIDPKRLWTYAEIAASPEVIFHPVKNPMLQRRLARAYNIED